MALRIAGVHIPANKHICIGLTSIYGIGRVTARRVCEDAGIPLDTKGRYLTLEQEEALRVKVDAYQVEGDLRRLKLVNIKRLMDIGAYRGIRHRRNLPVRGQRTRTNANTRRKGRKGKK